MKKAFKVLLVHANTMMENLIPVGMALLAGALRDSGINYDIFDTTFYKTLDSYPDEARAKNLQLKSFNYSEFGVEIKGKDSMINDFVRLVDDYKPSLIALSVVEPTYFLGLNLLKAVKKRRIPSVLGGVPAFFSPLDILKVSYL